MALSFSRAAGRLACAPLAAALLALCAVAPAQAAQGGCGPQVVPAIGETLSQLARRCGVTREALRAANPLLPNTDLLIPGLPVNIPMPPPPPPPPVDAIQYRVAPGDTLRSIARAHGISMPELLRLNPDVDAATLRVGDVVLLPAGAEPPRPPPPDNGSVLYTVKAGDTLGSIARQFNLTRQQVREMNPGLDPARLRVGDVLRLPIAPPPGLVGPGLEPGAGERFYEVRRGDTLGSIARAQGVTRAEIRRLNPDRNLDRLRVGDVLRLPRGSGAEAPLPPHAGPRGGSGGRISVVGTLTREGAECQAMRGDDGELYTLTGVVEGFRPGDRVRVRGRLAEASICQQGSTIEVSRIEEAR